MFDKFKTCQNCPDRTVEPNCRTDCAGYLFRVEVRRRMREDIEPDSEFNDFKRKVVAQTKKRAGLIKK